METTRYVSRLTRRWIHSEDCIVYYIPHPVIRIQIIYDNTTIHSQGHIRLGYFTENYTGYLEWDFISSTGETIRKHVF